MAPVASKSGFVAPNRKRGRGRRLPGQVWPQPSIRQNTTSDAGDGPRHVRTVTPA